MPFLGENLDDFMQKISRYLIIDIFTIGGYRTGHQTEIVYTYFAKVFDRVDHQFLVLKLLRLGFDQ